MIQGVWINSLRQNWLILGPKTPLQLNPQPTFRFGEAERLLWNVPIPVMAFKDEGRGSKKRVQVPCSRYKTACKQTRYPSWDQNELHNGNKFLSKAHIHGFFQIIKQNVVLFEWWNGSKPQSRILNYNSLQIQLQSGTTLHSPIYPNKILATSKYIYQGSACCLRASSWSLSLNPQTATFQPHRNRHTGPSQLGLRCCIFAPVKMSCGSNCQVRSLKCFWNWHKRSIRSICVIFTKNTQHPSLDMLI